MPRRQRQSLFVISFNVYAFRFAEQPISSHNIFAFMITVLLSFLQIQSSGTNPTPFELHPLIAMAFVGCLVVYYLAFGATFMFPAHASHFESAMSLVGSFCVVALVSLVLQVPWWSVILVVLIVSGLLLLVHKFFGICGHGILPPRRRTSQPLLPFFNVNE